MQLTFSKFPPLLPSPKMDDDGAAIHGSENGIYYGEIVRELVCGTTQIAGYRTCMLEDGDEPSFATLAKARAYARAHVASLIAQ